jgi:Holliday junction resolvase-like predicted endonuclease
MDCIVCRPDGRVTIVELKTAQPRAADRAQVAIYRKAAQQLFQAAEIDDVVLYVGQP